MAVLLKVGLREALPLLLLLRKCLTFSKLSSRGGTPYPASPQTVAELLKGVLRRSYASAAFPQRVPWLFNIVRRESMPLLLPLREWLSFSKVF